MNSLTACLLRFDDESAESHLARFFKYHRPDWNSDPAIAFIAEQANKGISVTPRILNDVLGVNISQEGLDPSSIDVYIDGLEASEEHKRVRMAGKRLLDIAAGRSNDDPRSVVSLLGKADRGSTTVSLQEQMAIGMAKFDERLGQLASGEPRLSFPWKSMNDRLPFIYDDDLILYTGQSKTGKTSAAHQTALYNARYMHVLYMHNEDNELKLHLRRTAQAQLINDPTMKHVLLSYRDLLSQSVHNSNLIEIVDYTNRKLNELIGDRLHYTYCAGWGPEQIISEIIRVKSKFPLRLVIIDYLNKIEIGHLINRRGVPGSYEFAVELIKREAGRTGAMCPTILVQQENENRTVRDTRASYIKAQAHISFNRSPEGDYISLVRANDGMTGDIPAEFFVPYMIWKG